MSLITFTPNQKIRSSELNANFAGLADCLFMNPDSIKSSHLAPEIKEWTPTITPEAGMSFTSVTTDAFYIDFGTSFYVWVKSTGTTGGTSHNDFNISNLPFAARSGSISQMPLAATASDGTHRAGFALVTGGDSILVRKYDASVWGLGASRRFTFAGLILKAD